MNGFIKSSTIILQKSNGEILLGLRSKELRSFPDFWVFPGGKIEEELPDDWIGDEIASVDQVLQELYEETGIVAGSPDVIPRDKRNESANQFVLDYRARDEFKLSLVFSGRRQTPPFLPRIFDAAYFYSNHKMIDSFEGEPDGTEIIELVWMTPVDIISKWSLGNMKIPPPVLHFIMLMTRTDRFIDISLTETELPVGLQTKIEFAPGFQIIPIESDTIAPFSHTNLILIENRDEAMLVDPGAKNDSFEHFRQILQTLDQTPKIFLTHDHLDHWNALPVIEDLFPDAIIYGHELTLSRIETTLVKSSVSSGNIEIGDITLQVLHTPGHTDGHLTLFNKTRGILIAGDHVVGIGSAVLSASTGNMTKYFTSTQMLIDLQPKLVYPAHGPVNFNPVKLLKYYIKHRTQREISILQAVNNGAMTLDDIVKTVYVDVSRELWEFAKTNIKLHLEKLFEEGRINELITH
ncbi:MAG: MBL fold metallo-hydrolase [Candidatus Heimdallarchaeota archaeon]|nr:MBL fold metallo-hydrolase [Candidatus Heimdallarchaeota archaeon]